jgi:hypothetical protein
VKSIVGSQATHYDHNGAPVIEEYAFNGTA